MGLIYLYLLSWWLITQLFLLIWAFPLTQKNIILFLFYLETSFKWKWFLKSCSKLKIIFIKLIFTNYNRVIMCKLITNITVCFCRFFYCSWECINYYGETNLWKIQLLYLKWHKNSYFLIKYFSYKFVTFLW